MIIFFEITPEGERFTVESRQGIVRLVPKCDLTNAEFKGGTAYGNPLHLASALVDGTYIVLDETDKTRSRFTLIKASAEVRNWLRSERHNTSYGALLKYLGRR